MFTLDEIMNYEKHPAVIKFIKDNIPLENVYGREQVPNSFIEKQLNLDPIQFAENLVGKDSKSAIGISMMAVHLKNAFINEVSKINFDFNENNSTWDEYLNGIKMLGFEEILSDHGENDEFGSVQSEIMFKHKDYTIIWIVNSFQMMDNKKVNSSCIYFNGTLKDENNYGDDIPMSRGYQGGTDIITANLDMRQMPSYYLSKVLSTFNIVDTWVANELYSKRLLEKEKILTIDDSILEKIYSKASRSENYPNLYIKDDFYQSLKKFYHELSIEEQEHLYIHGRLLDGRYSNNEYISQDIKEKLIQKGFLKEDMVYITAQIISLSHKNDFKNPWQYLNESLAKLTKSELKELLAYALTKKNETYSIYHFGEDTFKLIDKLINA